MKYRRSTYNLLVVLAIVLANFMMFKPDKTYAVNTYYRLPFNGIQSITSGPGCYHSHLNPYNYEAIDFGLRTGTPVVAAASGIAQAKGSTTSSDGLWVEIEHNNGQKSVYFHLSETQVNNGQLVEQGQQIGLSGATGWAEGEHLHFAVIKDYSPEGINGISVPIRDLSGITWVSGDANNPCQPLDEPDGTAVGGPISVPASGYIDAPAPNAQLTNRIKINGWAKSTNSTIKEVNIYGRLAGSNHAFVPLAKANYGEYRPDPGLAGPYGWSWEWDTSQYGNGSYELKVKATSLDGSSAWLLTSANHAEILSVTIQNKPHACLKPLYRYFHSSVLRHFYTQNWSELGLGDVNWRYENITGFVATSGCSLPSGTPLYRLAHNTLIPKHMYAPQYERDVLVAGGQYHDEGSVGLIAQQAQSQYVMAPLQRLYHAGRNDHFFTTSQTEVDAARSQGYQLENPVGQIVTVANVIPNPPTGLSPSGTTLNQLKCTTDME